MSSSEASGERFLKKLKKSEVRLNMHFESEEYYEAQQVVKTLYRRAMLAQEPDAALNLVVSSTLRLIEAKQFLAATDLALLIFDCFEQTEEGITSNSKELIFKILGAFPEGAETSYAAFGKAAMEWANKEQKKQSADKNAPVVGIPELHLRLARAAKKSDPASAHRHYLRSGSPAEHAMFLHLWSKEGFRAERDLYVARAVLQSLCLQNLKHANTVLRLYLKAWERHVLAHPEDSADPNPLESPLVHFLEFLLKTLERDAAPLFQVIRQKYGVSLARDESFNGYLDRIGEIYFGIKAYRGVFDMIQDLF